MIFCIMKYRSRTEIVSMVLDVVSSGATKTKIMYGAYLSYTQLKEYLSYMEENDLIKYEPGTQLYRISEKGFKVKHLYEDLDEMISPRAEDKLVKLVA
jgi:predicted transcriptional regulator